MTPLESKSSSSSLPGSLKPNPNSKRLMFRQKLMMSQSKYSAFLNILDNIQMQELQKKK